MCKYRPFICPYIECDHKFAAEDVVDHVSVAHRDECRRSEGPEITASMILIGMYFGELMMSISMTTTKRDFYARKIFF